MWKLGRIAEIGNKIEKRNETGSWKREATREYFNKPEYSKNRPMHPKHAWNQLQELEWVFEIRGESKQEVYWKINCWHQSYDIRYFQQNK